MSRGVRVKICGITRRQDALAAQRAGADAIGFVFAQNSRRYVTPEQAAQLAAGLGPLMARVGVFVDASPEEVEHAIDAAGLTVVQLHGNESAEYASRFLGRVRLIRAVSFGPLVTPDALVDYPADAILLDAAVPGSGVAFGWHQAARWRGHPNLILAGGLNAGNVAAGVAALRPYAVDVSSGVETAPGIKGARLMSEFVQAVDSGPSRGA